MTFPYRLGVVSVVYAREPSVVEQARCARDDGFEHIDPMVGIDPDGIALPIGCPTSFPWPVPGWCSTPAPADGPGRWDKTVARFRDAPGALLEPWAGSVCGTNENVLAMIEAVPGLRLLVDTGHVADWGGDSLELLGYADHVQLRQGCEGSTEVHVDDPRGTVDFRAVVARLEASGYEGCCSVEYFDIPEQGWALADPRAWAVDLARHLRAL